MSQLQLSLLGEPRVKHGEDTLTFSTCKAQALLVYLAVEGGTHTRKTLSESFWPELDAEHGRAALRATLFELRKLLERRHEPGERVHLHVGRDTLGLEQDSPLLLDIRLVESLSKQARRRVAPLAGEVDGALLAQLEQATRLARGPFLAGFTLRDSQFFDDWTRQHRDYWHLRVHQLFDALSRLYERAGEVERALATVSRWLAFDPLHEAGYRRLMRLRFSLGDRVGALRAYAHCRDVLADELQMEPEPETVALAKRIRRTAPVRSLPSQPPDSSYGQPSANLLDGPFLGRSAEFGALIECYQRMHAGQPHLVVLQGETGMGKTRLATEFLGWAQAQGADVLAGQALHTGRQLPYQPLIAVLRSGLLCEGNFAEESHAFDGYTFPRGVTRFLEQQCVIGAPYSIADKQLFALFKAFWIQAPERFDHLALLGQFRVELVDRGFHAEPGGKWPHWLGLTTREQDNQRHREERDRRPTSASPWEKIMLRLKLFKRRYRVEAPGLTLRFGKMQQADTDEIEQEQSHTPTESTEQAAVRVISLISWRIFNINLARVWLEKRVRTVFEPNFSRINWFCILSHLSDLA